MKKQTALHEVSKRTRFTATDNAQPNALKHGVYRASFTPEEVAERQEYEQQLIDDVGGHPTTATLSLIRRAGFLEMRLRRSERATIEGWVLADNIILSWVNAQRLLLCALGLERKAQPVPDLQSVIDEIEREKAGQKHLI